MGKQNEQDKRIIIIPAELLQRLVVASPAKWFVKDAMGNKVYFKVRDRATAQSLCDQHFGEKGKYTVCSEY